MSFYILLVLTLLMVIATLGPMFRISHWIVRSGDFPRLQLAMLAALLVLAQCAWLDLTQLSTGIMILAALGCLAVQLWWVLPYTPLLPKEVKTAKPSVTEAKITILTSNVLTPNRQADKLIALVKQYQPDVLVTLESDQWWEDQLSVLEESMPYTVKCPLENLYGMHVYSKLPMADTSLSFLVEEDVPSVHTTLKLNNGRVIRAHFLHPAPPSPTENTESDERDAEIEIVGRSVAESDMPVIVTGDLNDVAWSKTTRLFRKVSGLLDPRIGRGVFCTFHADYAFLRWPLDHVFHSKHFTLGFMKRMPSIGSDHFPLLTQLALSPEYGADQQAVAGDEEDEQLAKEMAREENVSKEDVPEPGKHV
ncbi:endonuclease/exonuclease/phosphatase family protein [Marinomonas ostreistagni]|uniref:endonuclease/exonuclease/phosphatase family protein n=1 Tax=Marinomonas ostreistagni TaxID=359209 RepID=UPI00194E318E|nr:endonuclease/exonuclease/phosphatase family protein [Marinomonas ostreistagni]MBM6551864.1 endonuclease/exonuclease/phosphatase family protein [Marinomonas ostreistagni]